MKRLMGFMLLLAVVFCSVGCLGPVELDENGYVVTIGCDRGKEKKYFFTFALQRGLSEPGTDMEGGAALLTSEGDAIDDAVRSLEKRLSCMLSFSRTNFFVFNREIAEAGDIEELLSISFDSLKIRPFAAVVVSECEAYRFIGGMTANNDANVKKLQSALLLDDRKSGMASVMSVSLLFEAAKGGAFDYTAALGDENDEIITDAGQKKDQNEGKDPLEDFSSGDMAGGLKTSITGTALFDGWRMTGKLTGEGSLWLDIACGSFKEGTVTLDTGYGKVSLMLKLKSVKRELVFEEGIPKAHVLAKLESGTHSAPEAFPEEDFDDWLKNEAPRLMEAECRRVFLICRDANSDAMRFGTEAVKRFSSYEQWLSYCWKSHYSELEASFTVELVNADKTAGGGLL